MAFFDEIRGKFSQAGQITVQRAKDISEVARLNNLISSTEGQINDLYREIGYRIYCVYHDDPLPEVAELINKVTELHQSIEDNKAQIKLINAAYTCPNCGAKTKQGMCFCSGCGYKLPVIETSPVHEEPSYCSNCGATIASGTAFCTSCGKKIE